MSLGFFGRGKKLGKAAVFKSAPDQKTTNARELRAYRLTVFVAFAIIVAALINWEPLTVRDDTAEYSFSVNQFARAEWRAEFPFETVDLAETNGLRDTAAAAVLDIHTVRREAYNSQMQELDRRFELLWAQRESVAEAVTTALRASDSSQEAAVVARQAVSELAEPLMSDPLFEGVDDVSSLVAWLMPAPGALPQRIFAEPDEGAEAPAETVEGAPIVAVLAVVDLAEPEVTPLEFANAAKVAQWARDSLSAVLNAGILPPQTDITADPERKIRIVRPRSTELTPTEELLLADVPTVAMAQGQLERYIHDAARKTEAEGAEDSGADSTALQGAALDLAKTFLAPTLAFNPVETGRARSAARASAAEVMKTFSRADIVQPYGERWTEQAISDVETYIEKRREGHEPILSMLATILAHMILAGVILLAIVRGLPLLEGQAECLTTLRVCLLVVAGMLVVGRVAYYFDDTGFLVPVAAGSILIAILVNARVAALAGAVTTALLSVQYGYSWNLLLVGSVMSLGGAMSISQVRRRGDMARAAFHAMALGMVTLVAITLAIETLAWETFSNHLILLALNGCACLFLVPGLLPPMGRFLGITTDIQLLEYSDLNNEILSRLAIEVPATYSHSLMLGQLGEAAAEAIGANGLLARVSAYYHDIGKIRRPEYFSENQTGVNIHDGLTPRLSARAIASHVIEGAEMARELHLPKPIVDGILEHHGTNLISFFYQQAQEQAKHGDVSEDDYRYPGPRPQSRETAILMICDAVESGVRTIKNPNEERVREFVDKIIASRSADRQFDECDLTLKELDIIGDVVSRRILSSLHTRVVYPDEAVDSKALNVIPMSGHNE
jgi:putative nucleotidyltransferase with HDIG domain